MKNSFQEKKIIDDIIRKLQISYFDYIKISFKLYNPKIKNTYKLYILKIIKTFKLFNFKVKIFPMI